MRTGIQRVPRVFAPRGARTKRYAIAPIKSPSSAKPIAANEPHGTGPGFLPPGTNRACSFHFSLNCSMACGIVRSPVLRPWSIVPPRTCSNVGSAGQPITTDDGIASRNPWLFAGGSFASRNASLAATDFIVGIARPSRAFAAWLLASVSHLTSFHDSSGCLVCFAIDQLTVSTQLAAALPRGSGAKSHSKPPVSPGLGMLR